MKGRKTRKIAHAASTETDLSQSTRSYLKKLEEASCLKSNCRRIRLPCVHYRCRGLPLIERTNEAADTASG